MSDASTTLPVIFFGHGSPMIALQTNSTTAVWRELGNRWRPKAILCVSAHWCTRGTAVTAMATPQTIHDFGAFPQALFDVQYPAPGSPELAARVRDLLAPLPVALDQSWGFDHGTWSVLVKAYPAADIPVVQLSMDATQPPAHHFAIGRKLAALRDEGVLIVGTGNVVHNLGLMNWSSAAAKPFDWAQHFDDYVRDALLERDFEKLVTYAQLGRDAQLSVPTPDHYWPLLYAAGASREEDAISFPVERIEHGSLSMRSVLFDSAAPSA
jgi:4,5-DOPA dioxygenase extradiol